MYISPFVLGVICTLSAEMIALILYALIVNVIERRKDGRL